jgi:hypothetical protein
MSHYRAAWRQAVETAILADPRFRDAQSVRPWNQNLSAEELPCLTVQTDREEITRLDKSTTRRVCTLRVLLWRNDNDRLDETLDDDSAIIEPIVLTALAAMTGAVFILDDPIFNGLAISLLFGIGDSITRSNIDIRSAIVTTLGAEAIDTLYVTEIGGGPLSAERADEVAKRLRAALK